MARSPMKPTARYQAQPSAAWLAIVMTVGCAVSFGARPKKMDAPLSDRLAAVRSILKRKATTAEEHVKKLKSLLRYAEMLRRTDVPGATSDLRKEWGAAWTDSVIYVGEQIGSDLRSPIPGETTAAAMRVLAGMGLTQELAKSPLWRETVAGLSHPNAADRIAFKSKAIQGNELHRALLRSALESFHGRLSRVLNFGRNSLEPGQALHYRYSYEPDDEAIWLRHDPPRPLVYLIEATNHIVIRGNTYTNRTSAFGFVRSLRNRNPLLDWRLYPSKAPALRGKGKFVPKSYGAVQLRMDEYAGEQYPFPITFRPPNLMRPWKLVTPRLQVRDSSHVSVLPPAAVRGKAVGGLRLRALGLGNYVFNQRKYPTIRVRIAPVDDRPHAIILYNETDDWPLLWGSWVIVLDEHGNYVGMREETRHIEIVPGEDGFRLITLERGKRQSLRAHCALGVLLGPGRYIAYVGFGEFANSKKSPPTNPHIWQGELLAKPVTFTIKD